MLLKQDSPLVWIPVGETPPPDGPAHLLREENHWNRALQEERRCQFIYVHHGQLIRVYQRDIGPSAIFLSTPIEIPGCIGIWPHCESVHTPAELIEVAALSRGDTRMPGATEQHFYDGARAFMQTIIDDAREQVLNERRTSIFGAYYRRQR